MSDFRKSPFLVLVALLAASLLHPLQSTRAGSEEDATATVMAMSAELEKQGFEFRSDVWVKDLQADVGKAVRVQLFKGNDYRFCIAVPGRSGVQITAAVLDFSGKPGGDIQPLADGSGLILSYKPKKTGAYAVAIRQTESGKHKTTACALITGYK
ncbi:MAG: hypothetical protein KDK97_08165 [Verrucomicrobiales bacterium]|nr:hypothetical protein [Verrucomicrobiales bacterium]MCP5560300.1 hypothetical protein [Verrucomicrobiaceae bacterium]